MTGFLVRIVIVAIGLWLATVMVPGIAIELPWTLLAAAVLLGIVNATVRPLVVLLTLPVTVVTLGLFLLVINAAMFALVAWMFAGFAVSGFWSAFFGALIVSLTGWIASYFIGPRGRVEVIYVRRRLH
ncbi:MAG: phage holin family protein [Pseudomonadota bacterium]|nr:MAG: phage holin family protein [Pseudomonadota bacterium]